MKGGNGLDEPLEEKVDARPAHFYRSVETGGPGGGGGEWPLKLWQISYSLSQPGGR